MNFKLLLAQLLATTFSPFNLVSFSGPLAWFLISIICGIGALFDPLLIFGALRKKVWAVHIWNFAQVFLCCIPLCALIPFTNKLIDEISEEMEIKRQEYVVISSGNNASNV